MIRIHSLYIYTYHIYGEQTTAESILGLFDLLQSPSRSTRIGQSLYSIQVETLWALAEVCQLRPADLEIFLLTRDIDGRFPCSQAWSWNVFALLICFKTDHAQKPSISSAYKLRAISLSNTLENIFGCRCLFWSEFSLPFRKTFQEIDLVFSKTVLILFENLYG